MKENKYYTPEITEFCVGFEYEIIIFLREWEDEELMWHVFENKQSIDAGTDEEEKIIPMLKRYLDGFK